MFSISNISIHFNGHYIFEDVSFIINAKDRIGLVGKNGSGKSTLLKTIKRIIKPERGTIAIPSGATVGYLPQELKINSRKTVFEEALTAFRDILVIQDKVNQLEVEISNFDNTETASYLKKIQQYNELNEKLQFLDGQNIEAKTEKVLTGLGFQREEFNNSLLTLSYGWQMRVELAKILLQQPNLVLLDEPTNHLDIESIQWLEEFLISYPGAVVIVSHDRALLDNVTRRTIEISLGKIYDYKTSYSNYIKYRDERIEQQTASYNNQQRDIRQIERFIERFRYKNTKAKQVQSRIKMLEKLDRVEIDETDSSAIHFSFPPAPSGGKIVIETINLNKSYGEKQVLSGVNFVTLRGEKIAFVGKNGEGKSTFTKILTQHLDYEGVMKIGHNISTGYYAQNQEEMLDNNKTVFETIDDIAVGDIRTRIRTILGGFLFSGEDIDKKVKVLSGGEKARLSIAKLLLSPANLLILDEPTNHLDMQSKDILKNALLQYKGTLVIVSHDRDFLQGLTTKVYEFKNRNIKEYIGDIYDFLKARRIKSLNELSLTSKQQSKIPVDVSDKKVQWEQKKQAEKEIRKLSNRISRSEKQIEELESQISELDTILANPAGNKKIFDSGEIYKKYDLLKKELDMEMSNWETLCGEREVLENKAKE